MNTKKQFFKYSGLSMLSTLGMSCYILADTLFIANGVGPLGLTSLNLVLPVYNLIFGIGAMLGVGGGTRFSILMSQDKKEEANSYFIQAIMFGLLVSIPFLVIGLLYPKWVVSLMGGNHEVMEIASLYLRTFIIFTPFFIMNYIVSSFVRNDHNPTLASIAMLAGTLFNIIFDYIFIFPCHLGMFGAALATGCSPLISMFICSLHFKRKDNHLIFHKQCLHIQKLYLIIKIGMSSLITELSAGIVTFVFNMLVLSIGGNIAVASYGIICNLAIVVLALYGGIAQGIQPLMSQCFGSHDYKSICLYLRYAVILSLVISVSIYGVVFLVPEFIISLFNGNQIMYDIAKPGLILYFFGFFFAGINTVFVSYFSSTQQVKQSFVISLLRGGIIIIPLVFILSYLFSLNGVWLSYPISEAIIMIVILFFHHQSQRIVSL